jgi:hypothetical protein
MLHEGRMNSVIETGQFMKRYGAVSAVTRYRCALRKVKSIDFLV